MLTAVHVSKSFGSSVVLRDVNFEVAAGTCVAFIGENGAGKSTLAKCLVGAHQPDAGSILIDGRAVVLASPADAHKMGIGFLPQELANVPALSVAENIVVGAWPQRFGITTKRAMHERARSVLRRLGVSLDLGAPMADQTLAARQLAEIAKALLQDSRLLVLDEPTAALSEQDSEKLFQVVRRLADDGVTIIFISHRMDEVHKFADTVHVMRNGELVASLDPKTTSKKELVSHMLGAPQAVSAARTNAISVVERVPALTLSGLYEPGPPPLEDVGFTIYEGELLGIFGVRGSGSDTIAEVLGGKRKPSAGSLTIRGAHRPTFSNPREAIKCGVGYVPQERKRDGLVLQDPIRTNVSLSVPRQVSRFGIRHVAAERSLAQSFAHQLDIRMRSVGQPVSQLSGGNQQKVLLASRLATHPRVLVLHEPTRGVDIGARAQLLRELRTLAAAGMACLIVSSDVEEVTTTCDRLLIIRDGAFVEELSGSEITQQNALHAATRGEIST
ncbi:sugar ABC transporter ATP-binding protein [Jatrophihabitans sp. DSM 45814]